MSKNIDKDRFYYNPEFLGSPQGRALRILSEYYGPLQRLQRNRIADTIVFFGSARIKSKDDAQKALDNGQDLSGFTSLRIEGETVTGIDFRAFSDIRMKRPPAFDSLNPDTRETNLFGTEGMDTQHFTRHAGDCVDPGSSVADETIVKMMNPTYYIGAPRTTTARLWRIRHGTEDRHTSLAIPVILATILENNGHDVDCELPWNTRHGGHYDLDEFFAWIDRICSP